jgi:glycosyltransferase involved in cell wall biosynthesis
MDRSGQTMDSLTLIVITKNEAGRIERCLRSVPFASQIIVVDSGSTDGTVAIASSLGAHVVQTQEWPGFGVQKNRALSLATCDWVLSLDADEYLSEELQREIFSVLQSSEVQVFRFPRSSSYCGRFMRYSGWYPDYVTRLFRRGQARFSDDLVHERLIVDGKVGTLRANLMHESFRAAEDVLTKLNAYSTAGAQKMYAEGRRSSLTQAVFRGCWAFFRTYVLQMGFLDGRRGFLLAVSNAEGTYYRYVKLWLIGQNQS